MRITRALTLRPGRNSAEASGDFWKILGLARGDSAPAAKFVVGLEHEYRVIDGDKKLDFRAVIHSLDLGQPRLDPADPYAYRLATGAKLTCDKEEAEIATPPIPIELRGHRGTASRTRAQLAAQPPRG